MDRWKTSTKRYTPRWTTHPAYWKMRGIELVISIPCQECGHSTNMHFFDIDHPDLGLCMSTNPENCNCTCKWILEQVQDG